MIEEAFQYLRKELIILLGEAAVTQQKGEVLTPNASAARFEVWTLGNRLQIRLIKLSPDEVGDEEVRSIPISELKTDTGLLFDFFRTAPMVLTHQTLLQICLNIWKTSPYAEQITDATFMDDNVDSEAIFDTPDGRMILKIQPQIIAP